MSSIHQIDDNRKLIPNTSVYNLKRRIASLPPISANLYRERVLVGDSRQESEELAEDPSLFVQSCIDCEQRHTSQDALNEHLKSQSHALRLIESASKTLDSANNPSPGDLPLNNTESAENGQLDDDEEQFNPRQCLFCNVESPSMESNLVHMSHDHSFFIPDTEYLVDMESFLSYLFIVISGFHECLYCGSEKCSKLAVQDHMRGKGHCKVDFESDEHELHQFYDFSGDADEGGSELMDPVILIPDEDELHLPSGKTLGHRSASHLSRRKTSTLRSVEENSRKQLPEGANSSPMPAVSNDRRVAMRAGTSTSMIGVSDLQQRSLIAVEQKMLIVERREKNIYQSKVDRGGNSQKTFRVLSMGKKMGGLEKRLG